MLHPQLAHLLNNWHEDKENRENAVIDFLGDLDDDLEQWNLVLDKKWNNRRLWRAYQYTLYHKYETSWEMVYRTELCVQDILIRQNFFPGFNDIVAHPVAFNAMGKVLKKKDFQRMSARGEKVHIRHIYWFWELGNGRRMYPDGPSCYLEYELYILLEKDSREMYPSEGNYSPMAPFVIRPIVKRFIDLGILPTPESGVGISQENMSHQSMWYETRQAAEYAVANAWNTRMGNPEGMYELPKKDGN